MRICPQEQLLGRKPNLVRYIYVAVQDRQVSIIFEIFLAPFLGFSGRISAQVRQVNAMHLTFNKNACPLYWPRESSTLSHFLPS